MLTYLRYALATFCFAASVGCLALWGWSGNAHLWTSGSARNGESRVEVFGGYVLAFARPVRTVLAPFRLTWGAGIEARDQNADSNLQHCIILFGHFWSGG